MSKDLSTKYYQDNKKRLQKSMWKISDFLMKRKKKRNNIVVNNTKIYQKMKNKSWLSIEKNTRKQVKTLYCKYRKTF